MVQTRTQTYSSSCLLVKNTRDHLNEGFLLSQDLEARLYGTKLENNEGIEIDKGYADIVDIVITKFHFSRWKYICCKD